MNHGKDGLVQLATKFYKRQRPLSHEKTKNHGEFAQRLNILVGSAFVILHVDLQTWCVLCRWVLCLLIPEQMAHRVAVCNELRTGFQGEGETEFHNVMIVNESWMFHYESVNRVHNGKFHHHHSSPKKSQSCEQSWKGYDDNFFWWGWFSTSASYISKPHCYSSVLPRSLVKNNCLFQKERPHRKVEEILLHHNNACPQFAHTVTKFLEKWGVRTVSHLLYGPDLAPCDFIISYIFFFTTS